MSQGRESDSDSTETPATDISEKEAAKQKRLANLKSWKPGQSGNPGGRAASPPGFREEMRKGFRTACRDVLRRVQSGELKGFEAIKAIEVIAEFSGVLGATEVVKQQISFLSLKEKVKLEPSETTRVLDSIAGLDPADGHGHCIDESIEPSATEEMTEMLGESGQCECGIPQIACPFHREGGE